MAGRLSSDILERQFGSTRIEVLSQDDQTRIICTKTVDGGKVLEISRVTFIRAGAGRFPEAHAAVTAGESMGKAFRKAGVEFQRAVRAAYPYKLPAVFGQWFGSQGPATVVDVVILVGPTRVPYAEILEIYSPAVRWPHMTGTSSPSHTIIRQLDAVLATRSPA